MDKDFKYGTWDQAHKNNPEHKQPGGKFGCPICLAIQLGKRADKAGQK